MLVYRIEQPAEVHMQTETTPHVLTEEEVQTLFRTDIGHFADKSARLLFNLMSSNRPASERKHLIQRILKHTKNTEVENQIMTGSEALVQQGKVEGLQEGLERGIERGEIQTKREDILKILQIRIGDIPDPVTKRVSRIRSRARLDSLFEQALTADTLDDIKWD